MDNGKLFQISLDLKQVEQIGTLLSGNKNEFGISDRDEFWLYSFLSTVELLHRHLSSTSLSQEDQQMYQMHRQSQQQLQTHFQ